MHLDEICVVKFDYHLSLIATGSSSGEIAILDYETSQFLGYLLAHDDLITSLEFVSPHPLLISASIDCKICVWTVRPVPLAQRYICIQYFVNKTLSFHGSDNPSAVNGCKVYRHKKNIEVSARPSGKNVLLAKTYRNFEANLILADFETDVTIDAKGKYKPPSLIEKARQELW